MLLVNIEGNLIENIVIYENELYFSYEDSSKGAVYTPIPTNEYMFNTDSFNTVQVFLYHPDYLGFYSIYNINNFKNCCLKNHNEKNNYFKYNNLSIVLEEIKDYELVIKEY